MFGRFFGATYFGETYFGPGVEQLDPPTVPGAEWTARGDRLHWTEPKARRLQWTARSDRLHWQTGEE